MAVPDFQTFMLPVLRSVEFGEARISEVAEKLAGDFKLTPEERGELLPSGKQTTLGNRIAWAKFYLGKAGLIESTKRGYFVIAPLGIEVLNQAPKRIDIKFLNKFPEFRAFKEDLAPADNAISAPSEVSANLTPDEVIRKVHGQLTEELGQELIKRVIFAPPDFFERLIIQLLVAMGYGGSALEAARALGKSGDNGVDGVIDQDALGLDRIYVQAKRYALDRSVGPGEIRDFFGALDRFKAAKGLFVTTADFSPSAKDTAEYLSKRIVLLNGKQLSRLMIRFNVGCRVEETIELKKVDEEFFELGF